MGDKLSGCKVVLFLVMPVILGLLCLFALGLWAAPGPIHTIVQILWAREFGCVFLLALCGVSLYIARRTDLPLPLVQREAFRIGALFVGVVALTLLVPGSYNSTGWWALLAALESVALLALLLRVHRHVRLGPQLLLAGLWLLASANGVSTAIKLL